MAILHDKSIDVYSATLTRRQFVKTGGALFVGFSLVGADLWRNPVQAAGGNNTLNPTTAGFVGRDPRRRHDCYSHRQAGFWSEYGDHGGTSRLSRKS